MRKKVPFVLIVIVLFFFLAAFSVSAETTESNEILESHLDQISEYLPNSVNDYLAERAALDGGNILNGFLFIIQDFGNEVGGYLKDPVQTFGLMLAIMICCAICQHFLQDHNAVEIMIHLVGSLAISAVFAGVVNASVASTYNIVELAENFTSGFIPIFTGILISTGHVTASALYGAGIVAAATAVSSIITVFIKPMTGILLGLAVVSGIQDQGIRSIIFGIKRVLIWIMGILTSLFIGLIGLQSLISAQSDTLALRTTKYLVGSSIPIIGSSVSEAAGTVTSSLKVIKATVGSVGILSLAAIFLPVIIKLVLVSFSLSLAAVSGEALGADSAAQVVRAMKSVVEIIIALVVFYFISLVVCTAIMIQVGSGA